MTKTTARMKIGLCPHCRGAGYDEYCNSSYVGIMVLPCYLCEGGGEVVEDNDGKKYAVQPNGTYRGKNGRFYSLASAQEGLP